MKQKSVYICNECGYQSPKWMGKCPGCGAWSSMEETIKRDEKKTVSASKTLGTSSALRMPRQLRDIKTDEEARTSSGIGELDRVLGGGIVGGSLILVGGDPGIGKSTLLLQICHNLGKKKKILYIY